MNPDDVPLTWLLRLVCSHCHRSVYDPDRNCEGCRERLSWADMTLATHKGVTFP